MSEFTDEDRAVLIKLVQDFDEVKTLITKLIDEAKPILNDIKPTVDQIMKHPLLKVLGVKAK